MTRLNKKGFTLVEIIVVIAIIGILSAIMIPSMIVYVNNQKIRNSEKQAEAYSITIQSQIAQTSIEESDDGFNLDEIVKMVLSSTGEIRNNKISSTCKRKSLTPETGNLRYVFCYSNLKLYALKPSEMKLVEKDGVTPIKEASLFPNEWQVNSELITEYYGYFASFTKYRFNISGANDKNGDPIDYYGYDITYKKGEYIEFGSTPGLYDDDNKLLEPWQHEDKTTELCSDITSGANYIKFTNKMANYPTGTQLILPSTFYDNTSAHTLRKYHHIDNTSNITNAKLKKVYMPNALVDNYYEAEPNATSIKVIDNGFMNMPTMEFIRYPEGSTEPGGRACENDTNLHYIHLPDSMTSLTDVAFKNTGLKNFTLPYGVKTVMAQAFRGMQNLECFAGSRGLYGFGSESLADCPNLREVYFYRTLGTDAKYDVGINLFANCTSLEKVYFDGNVYRYTEEASLTNFKESVKWQDAGKTKLSGATIYCHYQTNPYDQEFSTKSEYSSFKYWYYSGYQILAWQE